MRLRPLSEAECYARCYGGRREDVSLLDVSEPEQRGEPAASHLHELLARRLTERAAAPDLEAA